MKISLLFLSTAMALAQPWPQPSEDLFQRNLKNLSLMDQVDVLTRDYFGQKPKTSGRWWSNPATAQKLNLTADQLRKMDDIFQQHRLKLIDLNASLQKEEAILEPLVAADAPDDAKVLPQLDRVAQARAELEKANGRMLWAIRRVLTPDQWKNLQSEPPKPKY